MNQNGFLKPNIKTGFDLSMVSFGSVNLMNTTLIPFLLENFKFLSLLLVVYLLNFLFYSTDFFIVYEVVKEKYWQNH